VILEMDPGSAVPPYEQIRSQIATMIETGVLAGGHQLPPIRGDLGLAVNTVARAYRELETAGLVIGRTRHGTTGAAGAARLPRAEIKRRLAEAARNYTALAQRLGVSASEAEATVRVELGRS
jgi:DNA-binding transcriptional regulator YhcF (GntR family)